MSNLESSEDLVRKFAAGKLFRIAAISQGAIHLCAYIASFIKLISIEGGGYYNREILLFLGITIISMPLFLVTKWLIEHSLKISRKKRLIGYYLCIATIAWSLVIIKISYVN
jgi:hypothetical protein